MEWNKRADEKTVAATAKSLEENGISVFVVENGEEARVKALELIPKGSEVFTATSVTADTIGIANEVNESGKYNSVRNKLHSLDRSTQRKEMAELASTPDWVVGSVHAVTEDGKVLIASATGSQLPAYLYGAPHVIWIVGTQKIVKDLDQGMRRIYEYALPLEGERARKAYGAPGSVVAKLAIVNKEVSKDRITMILVKEVLGF
ncbi:MAG: LUD domain-containing protein [Candidatus Micrarchaeota archaeon]|nr:LUD domain-containing protein [Candidatus Micrarchaeota archaeon]